MYDLIGAKELPRMAAAARVYRHRSGAEVLIVNRPNDDNKVFAAAFRTPPSDDTGAAHIVEHCVLSGSEMYPVKDAFNELAKGSLHTFINAMTYPGFTVYPAASRNRADFFNMASVYLDAVFCPLIYTRAETFLREGWRLEADGDRLVYNGIVLNEMKGARSDPKDRQEALAAKALFPDTAARFSSDGEPSAIPTLTREAFLRFHREHYAPANCLLYFYGDVADGECLNLAAEWLDRLPAGAAKPSARQAPLAAAAFVEDEYQGEAGGHVSARFVTGGAGDAQLCAAMEVLTRILVGAEASPLKRALAALGGEVWGEFAGHHAQPIFSVGVKDTAPDGAAFWAALRDALAGVTRGGLSEALAAGALNRYEFESKEEAVPRPWLPKGLMYLLRAVPPWAAGEDALPALDASPAIAAMREGGAAYFNRLIETYLLNNPHAAVVTLKPRADFNERLAAAEAKRLAGLRGGMTQAGFEAVKAEAARLAAYNDAPDAEAALAAIPLLSRGDVSAEPALLPAEWRGGRLFVPMGAGVTYARLMFDAAASPVPQVGALAYLLGKLDTGRRGFEEFSNAVYNELGGLTFHADVITANGRCKPMLVAAAKAADENAAAIFELAREALTRTRFDDKERIRLLLAELKAKLETEFITKGHLHAVSLAESRLFTDAAVRQIFGGALFYRWLSDLLNDYDAQFEALRARLAELCGQLFTRRALTVACGAGEAAYAGFDEAARRFEEALEEGVSRTAIISTFTYGGGEPATPPGGAMHHAQSADYRAAFEYSGRLRVVGGALTDDYLMTEVRVKGGAYGLGASFSRDGAFTQYSFRDPQGERTFKAFDGAGRYLERFNPSEREMTKYVLGAISGLDMPRLGADRLAEAAGLALRGITEADLRRERREVLETRAADVRAYGAKLEGLKASRCSIG